jgi:hypothetical protein
MLGDPAGRIDEARDFQGEVHHNRVTDSQNVNVTKVSD